MKAEAVGQSQGSSLSSHSGFGASDNNNPSVSEPSSAESEKQTRQAPKRKPVRRARKPPLLKKKLRSSVPTPEKSSSDSVDEEAAESDIPPVLEKEHQSDVESNHTCTAQADVETESANELESCNEQIEENEKHTESHDTWGKEECSFPESSTQDTPVLVEEDEIQNAETTATEANVFCLEGESPTSTSEKGSDSLGNQEQAAEQPESEVTLDTAADRPSNDPLTCAELEVEVHPHVSPEGEELVVKEERDIESSIVELTDHEDTTIKTQQTVDSPKLESSEDGIIQTRDTKSIESPKVQLLGPVETEDAETVARCDASGNESASIIQDTESNVLESNTESDKSEEDKAESMVENLKSSELPSTHTEQVQKDRKSVV